ncbi:MAG: RNA methyltransferase [Acetobacteraceae bacterium]|nr:RNA methyltransferase [Acetobacteraceae bacterium]
MSKAQEPDKHCGPAAVAALFAQRPADVLRFFYTPMRRQEAGAYCAALAKRRLPYREVPPEELQRIAGTTHHGGMVAVARPRGLILLDVANLPPILWSAPVLPILDGIGNPHNLGAIARSAAFFGCKALVISGDNRQARLSDAALRTAEGGLEALTVFQAPDLPSLLRALAPQMLSLAAVAREGEPPETLPRGRPFALVLGNEEKGLTRESIAASAARVTLPGSGAVESLNVSVAAAVLIHALWR